MVPSAERVRFTVTGTEATMLALRLARAYTGKPMVVRFTSHFHGWNDHVAFGAETPAGILPQIVDHVLLCPPNDIGHLKELCEGRNDIAAVILEPTGATFGQVPLPPRLLPELRELTKRRGIVLIFDEVITGFRCSPGGAQQHYGVTPDLTTLAKIVAGGFPGAALVGKAEILSAMEYRDSGAAIDPPLVAHQGTYNAGPISAAAGIATLRLVRDSDVIPKANAVAAAIRSGMNDVVRRLGIGWCVYGEFSDFHIYTNPDGASITPQDIMAGKVHWSKLKGGTPIELLHKIRAGFLCGGVDVIGWPGGVVSGVHTADDADRTISAFESLLRMLAEEGAF
jgi:glutamate-1-semialdehyde 2,1-aminomutase